MPFTLIARFQISLAMRGRASVYWKAVAIIRHINYEKKVFNHNSKTLAAAKFSATETSPRRKHHPAGDFSENFFGNKKHDGLLKWSLAQSECYKNGRD